MSGPALRNVDSHSSIHEAALEEAKELTELLGQFLMKNELDKALDVAYIIIEHWETRTLQHATSEEEGLYKETVESKPELRDSITSLTRDHDLMRYLAGEIRELLASEGISDKILQRFHALILIDLMHNRDELKMIGEELEESSHESDEAV
ncbi:hemerythrin domain-containing protein [Paenibacillus crassostreae]|uniref:Uncharacterized protein n=1 Tax=Paenibacillus crassostreae TaxID=1763538 RepID=A0A167DWM8_9BACL|nr:hemerythrin domain-containing protein [Paenibacillus crassostreae]AOZ90972.1 hypothetical protein LPB68_01315 [Paenibacillus crassostreae]OAB74864.1 hypothetical protein PNBC_12640 [Paenibacillus crassostreae]